MSRSVRIDVRLDGADAALQGVERLRRAVSSGHALTRVGRALKSQTVRVLRELTPRQQDPGGRAARSIGMAHPTKRGHQPMYKGWAGAERVVTDSLYEAFVSNAAAQTAQGIAALASLEFGADPHDIFPVHGRFLAWEEGERPLRFQGRGTQGTKIVDVRREVPGQGLVKAQHVRHPGHEAFRMVEETERIVGLSLDGFMNALANDFSQAFADSFGGRVEKVATVRAMP